jgi:hypothetical protein
MTTEDPHGGPFSMMPLAILRSKDPILVTRRGPLAGVFFPRPEASLPVEFKT